MTVEDTDHHDSLEVGEADQSGGQETGLDEGVHESYETFDDTLGSFHLYDHYCLQLDTCSFKICPSLKRELIRSAHLFVDFGRVVSDQNFLTI